MTDPLSITLAALADPTRRAILARLAQGQATVNELAGPFEISLPAVSRHLKVLEHAGLISRGRNAQWRPCKLEVEKLKAVDDWLSSYRRFWAEGFDKMAAYIEELNEGAADERAEKTR
jgi:DNA-binding transcriptional ArsR family regulator